jgi:hypothetical protein
MGVEAVLAAGVVLALIALLMFTRLPVDPVFVAALTIPLVSGVLSPAQALAGFAKDGLATVAVHYVVVAGLRDTGAPQWLAGRILGQTGSDGAAQLESGRPVSGYAA